MFHFIVLISWLLATSASRDMYNNTNINNISTTPATSEENCSNHKKCGRFEVCYNNTCTHCEDICSIETESYERVICKCSWWLTDEELKVVAQAVLGIAVFVTFVALGSLIWKICARRIRRRRAASTVDLLDDSASLTSEQVFVVERLRDRPPCYEDAARDFAVEKPPAYSQVVAPEEGTQIGQRPPPIFVGDIPVTLVGTNLTARDFVAPPPYSERHQLVLLPPPPPPVPPTPPVQRLRRCVRKVVVIRRIGRSIPSLEVRSNGNTSSNSSSSNTNTTNNSAPKHKGSNQNGSTFTAITNQNVTEYETFNRKADTAVSNAILPESRELQNQIDTGQSNLMSAEASGKGTQLENAESENSNNPFTAGE